MKYPRGLIARVAERKCRKPTANIWKASGTALIHLRILKVALLSQAQVAQRLVSDLRQVDSENEAITRYVAHKRSLRARCTTSVIA